MASKPEGPKAIKRVEFTPSFKKNLRKLARKYPHIRRDLDPVLKRLESGALMGDLIPKTSHSIYKARLANSDQRRGKRGGYRLIYLHQPPNKIILVTLYSKSDQSDIPAATIRRLVKGL